MDVEKKGFSCKRGPFEIRGFAYHGMENRGIPVIMSHGFLANQKSMEKYARALAKAGYATFTYDFCGGALLGKSDGKFSDMSIDTEKEDLRAVISFVKGLDHVDGDRLILLGASQGGFVSCMVAAEGREHIDRMVLLYPALCIPDDARRGKMMMMEFDPEHIRETFHSRPFKFSAQYPESAMNIHFDDELKKIGVPVLIIHGTEDRIVNPEYAKRAERILTHPARELIMMEGAGHGFKKAQAEAAIGHIIAYLAKTEA